MVFAYIAPETILPVTSALATAAGFLLMFGRRAIRPIGRVLGWIIRIDRRPARQGSAIPAPHILGRRKAPGGEVAATMARRDDS